MDMKSVALSDKAVVQRGRSLDFRFEILGFLVMVLAIAVLSSLIIDLLVKGLPRIDASFFTNFPSRRPAEAGILSAWVGSSLLILTTIFFAVPLGVGAGIYLEEYAPKNKWTDLIEINISNLAGVPSIIYGLLALGLFIRIFGFGEVVFVAGMTLALLILPIIIVSTREAIRAIPLHIREASYGIGADKWQTVSHYIIPMARPGILTGIIVGIARALGETAPIITIGALTFIAFLPPPPIGTEFPFLNFDWLNSPFTAMPIQMFNWTSRPQPEFHINAAATGLILVALTFLINSTAIYLRYRIRKKSGNH